MSFVLRPGRLALTLALLAAFAVPAAADNDGEAFDDDHDRAMFHLAFQYDLHGADERAMDLYGHCAERAPAHVNALINLAVVWGLILLDVYTS